MNHPQTLPELAFLTLTDPQAAGEIVLRWNLSREALWTAILLVGVVMTIMSVISNAFMPLPEPFQAIGANPFLYLVIAIGGFVATVLAIYWTGRMMGGHGTFHELMSLLLWLQTMRACAQAIILAMLWIAPFLGSLFALFVGIATLWIFVNFIKVGLRLSSLWRSFFVLVLGAFAFMVILSFLISLLGVSPVGV